MLINNKILIYLSIIFSLIIVFSCPSFLSSTEIDDLPELNVGDLTESIMLGNYLEYIEDTKKTLTINDVRTGRASYSFMKSEEEIPNWGYNESAFWIRFTLKNDTNKDKDLLLELSYPFWEKIHFYPPENEEPIIIGQSFDFDKRIILHENFLFPISINSHSENTYYMKLETVSSTMLPLRLWNEPAFYRHDHNIMLLLGIYFGIIIVMGLYNLVVFFYLMDKSYLFYVLFIVSFGFFQFSYNGLSYEYLWPWLNSIGNKADVFFVFLTSFWGILFSKSFLMTRINTPKLNKVLIGLAILNGASSVCFLFLPYSILNQIASVLTVIFVVTVISIGIICVKNKYKPAQFYLAAWSVLLFGMFIHVLKLFTILPSNAITNYSMQIGATFGIIILSTALGRRISIMRKEKEKAQEELIQNLHKINKMKDEFLANTSHELKTPLNGIIGITESLIGGVSGQLDDLTNYNLSLIVYSGKRLLNLVNDILDFSRLKEGDIKLDQKPIDIKSITDVVVSISEQLITQQNLLIRNEIEKDLPPVYADENRFQQIMINLISNSIKFTEAGEIVITAEKKNEDYIEISISDTGKGISEEKLDSIFKPFEQVDMSSTREYGGTGLGLSITKKFIELHKGRMSVKSKEGEGSTFSFTLPIYKEEVLEKRSIKQTVKDKIGDTITKNKDSGFFAPMFTRFRKDKLIKPDKIRMVDEEYVILIVDDEMVNLQVLSNHLLLNNYKVIKANNGEEALNKLEGNGKVPDLILLDIMMPRMNGFQVCQKIREKYPPNQLPVIMLTVKNQTSDIIEGFNSGANDYITKPFSKNELLARIKTHIELAKINIAYGRFIPYEFLNILKKESILDVKLGDHIQKDMTIMFSDIRSFTALSESMTPKENFDFLNSFLKRIAPIIRAKKGFIDKYIGDAVMALFSDSPDNALISAIEIQKEVIRFNKERNNKSRPPIKIGIGLHTGTLILGTIGEDERMDETVISDAVNVASRLEGLTKLFGLSIIISMETLTKLSDSNQYNYRFLGKVRVKGRRQPLSIFEVFDDNAESQIKLKNETKGKFDYALKLYFQRNFKDAKILFEEIIKRNPDDSVAKLYTKRCQNYQTNKPSSDWEGIETFQNK